MRRPLPMRMQGNDLEYVEAELLPGKQVYSFHEIWVVVEHLGIPVAILGNASHESQVFGY
jgi:hypothetical protein